MARIYLDSSASTPLLPEAWDAMGRCLLEHPGNPASGHAFGRRARRVLEDARERIAHLLDAQPDEVIFTSGATEANNLALLGLVGSAPSAIVTSSIEHPCVLEPARRLADLGYRHVLLPVARTGRLDLDQTEIPEDARLVSVMLANHETGALQPVQALATRLPASCVLHCDAAAAVGKMPLSLQHLGVQALTISAHKFHGPVGIGALLVRKPARLRPLFAGGHQQHGKRPGTEPVMLAVGMAVALEWCVQHMEENRRKVQDLRRCFIAALTARATAFVINGDAADGLPHILNLAFPGCRADALMMNLDLAGVACSAGAACSSGSLLPSPVLEAMGLEKATVASSLRFSFSSLLKEAEVVEASRIISITVNKLRQQPCT